MYRPRVSPAFPASVPLPTPFGGRFAAVVPGMSGFDGEASASSANQIPSIGLAVVDSTAERRIKAFDCHALAFPRRLPWSAVSAPVDPAGWAGQPPRSITHDLGVFEGFTMACSATG